MEHHRARRLLGLAVALVRHRVAHAALCRAGRGAHARCGVVPGRASQLRAPGAAPWQRGPRGRAPGGGVPERAHGRTGRTELARASAPGGGVRRAAARRRRDARRPRLRHPAQPARGAGGLSGQRQPGRHLEHLQPRHGPGGRARPLPPDRAEGAGGCRRPGLGRRGARPPRRAARSAGGPALGAAPGVLGRCGRGRRGAGLRGARPPGPPLCRLGRRRRAGRLAARVAALRPPAVDRLQQRHHRPAQAHRARARRRDARDAERRRAAQRRGPQRGVRRALPLVQQHRLDHVERAGRRAARRHNHLPVRRQPGWPGGR